MDLLSNDLSIHGQFTDLESFKSAIKKLMKIRRIAQRYGRQFYCHRMMLNAQVTPTMKMPEAVKYLSDSERKALMVWLTRVGPFWDDERQHDASEWFECSGNIVTDTAIGEAAWFRIQGLVRSLVSFAPSNWEYSPIVVSWMSNNGTHQDIKVHNYWIPDTVEKLFKSAPPTYNSWESFEAFIRANTLNLFISADAFNPLVGHPFVLSAAKRLFVIFEILNTLKLCFDKNGKRNPKGHEIYQNYFTGKAGQGGRGSLFSDSSNTEKADFEDQLTFAHPEEAGQTLFCPYHGKVQTPQLRVHFSWPITANEPLYIVYVGPKITKQ